VIVTVQLNMLDVADNSGTNLALPGTWDNAGQFWDCAGHSGTVSNLMKSKLSLFES